MLARHYYASSQIIVQVNGVSSKMFSSTVGNKQGGLISAEFYDQYGDEMTYLVEDLVEGIWLGSIKCDIAQYADDVTLIAETAKGFQKQIDVCSEYGSTYGIQFNPEKTMIIVFNVDVIRTAEEIMNDSWQNNTLNGMPIQVVNSIKILGQIISDDGLDVEHIEKRMKATNGMTAKLNCMNLTSLHIHPKTKAQLFRTYFRPILTYGTENMALDTQEINQLKRMEGNCLKRMLQYIKTDLEPQ